MNTTLLFHGQLGLRRTAAVMACLAASLAEAAQPEPKSYTIEARVYYMKPAADSGASAPRGPDGALRVMNIVADQVSVDGDADPLIGIVEDGELEIAGTVLRLTNGEVSWLAKADRTPDNPQGALDASRATEEPDPEKVVTIARPTLVTPAGVKGQFQIVQMIQAFRRLDDGTFQLYDVETGCALDCTVTPQDDPKSVRIEWESTVKRLTGREEIPGVALPIGGPIIATNTVRQGSIAKLGAWSVMLYGQGAADGGALINLVRVTESEGAKK